MRAILVAAALLGLPYAASAQVVQCQQNDAACRVHHNDDVNLGTKIDALGSKLDAILSQLKATPVVVTPPPSGGGATPPPPPPTAGLGDPCVVLNGQKWTTLVVDSTASIGKALACANPAFKLTLQPGVYNQVFDVPAGLDGFEIAGAGAALVKVSGQGGCTIAENNAGGCGTRLSWGKGVIHVQSSGTIHDLEVADGGSRATGGHDGQAGIYIEANAAGPVLLQRIMFRNNENGAFANAGNTTADITIQDSDFVGNGTGDGGSHSSYIAGGKSLTLNNIHDYGSNNGNDQKSRVPTVTSNGGFYRSTGGRWIECADGCVLTINGGTFVGQTFGQNVFGNGTESTSKGPGNTTWTGPSTVWVGRASDFANAGTFQAAGVTVLCGDGGSIFNDHNTPLNGLPGCTAGAAPADPPYVSGAK